jgi:hypothetical protein
MNSDNSQGVTSDLVFNRLTYYNVNKPGLQPYTEHYLFEEVVEVDLYLYINPMVDVLK